MKWWKRLIFSVISLIWGYISVDYLYFSFGLLSNNRTDLVADSLEKQIVLQLAGAGLFLFWFFLMGIYTGFLRKVSFKIDFIEKDPRTGRQKVKQKWFDIVLQYIIVLTGMILRWGYLNITVFR